MANGYSQSPRLLKGAIIQFSAPLLVPIPNIIIFQYNPEKMTRTLTPWAPPAPPPGGDDPKVEAALAQPYDPGETFSLSLELDAADALEAPDTHPVASVFGVADRIAAIEMLLYPPGDSALGGLVSAIGSAFGASVAVDVVPRKTVPVVLFFWGPGRIVPVRITSFSIDEQAYSPTLYPIRAKATLGLKILDAAAFGNDDSATVKIAKACYTFTRAQKELLALANVANSVESIMGMLPL
ncbi:MAG TPA: hypothetical protein VK582_09355 [Pyrinomonadaceae bacterium]|nr:hypothetical protein [Pyrinomonadaceae bacterium]